MKIIKKIIFQKKKPIADNVKMNLAYLSVKFYALKVEMSGLRLGMGIKTENQKSNRKTESETEPKFKNNRTVPIFL